MAVHEDSCFICLGTEQPLIRPCRCLTCHQTCLARWQLQSAGKEEESKCRFCKQALPSWKAAFRDVSSEAAPVMSIQYNGHTYWLQVKPGDGGVAQFKEDVRRLLSLTEEQAFDITFECRVPGADESKLELQGLHAYDAAVYCASLSAARRSGSSSSKVGDGRRRSTGCGAAGLGSSLWARSRNSSYTGSINGGTSSSSSSSSSSGSDVTAAAAGSSSGSDDGSSEHGEVSDLALPSWVPGCRGNTGSSSAPGKFCLLQAAATHLLASLRLLWQAPDDIEAFC